MHRLSNRTIWIMLWFISLGMMPALTSANTNSFDEGIEYQRVIPAQAVTDKTKIEVLEIFWYACSHCYQLEPQLEEWIKAQKEDVNFIRMPAILNDKWEILARAYYVAQILGIANNIHRPLFDAIHARKKNLNNEDALARFFVQFGVSEEDFHKTYNSFGVITKVNQARKMTKRYGISGVPTMVVNGEFRTSATLTGSHEGMLKAVDYLVESARKK